MTKLSLVATGLASILAAAGMFARLMNYEMRRDEQLYVSPAALLDDARLYQDFFYNHVPGSAWLFHGTDALFGDGGLLFSARVTIFLAWVLFAAGIAFFTFRLTRSATATLMAVALIGANDFLLGVTGSTATNNFLPLPFAYAGLCLFALGVRGEGVLRAGSRNAGPHFFTLFAAGLSFAVALSIKVSAIAFVAPVAVAAFLLPGGISVAARLKSVVLPFALGGILGALPVLIELARAPDLFLAHVVQYHTGPHVAYWRGHPAGEDDVALSLGAKAMLAHQIWFGGVNLLLGLAALISVVSFARQREGAAIGLAVLGIAVAASVALFGFAPTPSFPQYYAPLSIALVFLIAVVGSGKPAAKADGLTIAMAAIAALALVAGAPRLLQHMPRLAKPSSWTVVKIHAAGRALADEIEKAGVSGKVLTFLPVYPLEGGLDVYPEFATGQFVYRTGDLTPPDLLALYRTTAPSTVAAFLDADPPAAMLLGFEPDLEAPMLAYAVSRGYRKVEGFAVKDRYGDGFLMVRAGEP
ncbi:MAG: hypothetical protein ACKVS5_03970 [Parvularculaceae bacterium]